MTKAERVSGACAEHGEGPFWDAAGDQLLFVDLERGAALAMTDSGTVDRHEFGGVTAAIRARRQGGHVLAASTIIFRVRRAAIGLGILRRYCLGAACDR